MIKTEVESWIAQNLTIKNIEIQNTAQSSYGDFSIPPSEVTRIIKDTQYKNIDAVCDKLEASFKKDLVEGVDHANGFINITLSNTALQNEAEKISNNLPDYLTEGNLSQRVVIDYSQPNIAKPFSVGHLRSTVIGQANLNIHKALGIKTFGVNHIGDWGTQFGKLIYAVKTWGDEKEIKEDPITGLVELYQKFHREAETNPALNKEASDWFRKLELRDKEATELWEKCINWSFAEFNRLYKLLGIQIDETVGESFYADKTDEVIQELQDKNLLKKSKGAQIVELKDMPPAIIQKSNQSTLYLTRDLAAVKYRIEHYDPDEIIYHVGSDQSLHFRQLFAVVAKLGWARHVKLTFAGHGMMRLPEGKMSTRYGRVVLLNDLLNEAKKRVENLAREKDKSDMTGKELQIAISAIKYADLSSNRQSDITFSFDRLIDLKGNSAIYLQYTYARVKSLLKEYKKRFGEEPQISQFSETSSELLREGILYKNALKRAASASQPNVLCDFVYGLANKFNSYYEKNRIICESKAESQKNISIVLFCEKIFSSSLEMLGLSLFDKL